MSAFDHFTSHLASYHPLSKPLVEYLMASVRTRDLAKGALLLTQGSVPRDIWYLKSGGARVYRHDPQSGGELTIWFWKNELVLPLDGIQGQLPSTTNIALLEPATVISLSHVHLKYLPQLFPEYHSISQAILETLTRNLSEHLDLIQHTDSAERYQLTLERNHQLFQKSSLKDIASYLGMSISTIKHLRYGQSPQ